MLYWPWSCCLCIAIGKAHSQSHTHTHTHTHNTHTHTHTHTHARAHSLTHAPISAARMIAVGHWWSTTIPKYVGTVSAEPSSGITWRRRELLSCGMVSLFAQLQLAVCSFALPGTIAIVILSLCSPLSFIVVPLRYCRGVHAIVYMVDAAAPDKMDSAKAELHALLQKDQLAGIPVLVLGNKNDLPNALEVGDPPTHPHTHTHTHTHTTLSSTHSLRHLPHSNRFISPTLVL
jgi:hypothetical protein